ncbi:MAG: homocysteine S-methyltransferase [Lachnospiraceae bacterium]|nr:homocysteine S-methyltransferase [Lachnospiraceae bacterium]
MDERLGAVLEQMGRIVIDGSMGTALKEQGLRLDTRLWTAQCLIDRPELVETVHRNYFRAGADCGITDSYQASIPGLLESGYKRTQAEEIIARSVRVLKRARETWWQEEGRLQNRAFPLCLASVGPYGAYLADGSEYRGRYGVSQEALRTFHRRRIEILLSESPDLLLFETQPSLEEVLVETGIAEELGADYWVSFSCLDGAHLCDGTKIKTAAKALSKDHPHLVMIGVNCTAPKFIVPLIKALRAVTDLPAAAYPNSGAVYDPKTKTWTGDGSPEAFYGYALSFFEAGAMAVGGCCTTDERHIRQVTRARADYLREPRRVLNQ